MAPTRGTGDQGVALILTALHLVPLMIFAAFGVDLASWYCRISYLQKSADAAALAGTVWMPDLAKAIDEAKASLRANGVVDKDEGGTDNVDVVIERGSRAHLAPRDGHRQQRDALLLPGVRRGDQTLTRSGEAEYNLPLPLGSPLNYFGGDCHEDRAVGTYRSPPTTPLSDRSTSPCNIGSSERVRTWAAVGQTSALADDYRLQQQRRPSACGGRRTPAALGTTTVPPPDYRTRARAARAPATCSAETRRRPWKGDGAAAGPAPTTPGTYTGNQGGNRQCTWTTSPASPRSRPMPPPVPPSNRPCDVGYAAANGRWSASTFQANQRYQQMWEQPGNVLCGWAVVTVSVNPITRSPGFWAQIDGPGADHQSGDAYSTRCWTATNCGSPDNPLFTDDSDANRGYWYVVKIPAGGGGATKIRMFDAQLHPGRTSPTAGRGLAGLRQRHVVPHAATASTSRRTPWTSTAGSPSPPDHRTSG